MSTAFAVNIMRSEGIALKRGGLAALVVCAGLSFSLSSDIPHDISTTLQTKYAAGTWPLAMFVATSLAAIALAVGGILAIITGMRGLSLTHAATRKGLLVMWTGATCLTAGLISGNAFEGRDDVFVEWGDLFAALAYVFVGVGILLMRTGWKYDVQKATEVLATDARPPVLYLRSFQDDVRSPVGGAFGVWLKVMSWFFPVSFEQELAAIMNRLGPFVAVGRPGERLPELGANRYYFSDDEWRSRVSELVQRARLTVILCGSTGNLWWEIDHVLASVSPRQVVLLVPERGKRHRETETRLEERLGIPSGLLTDEADRRSMFVKLVFGRSRTLGKVVFFGDDWTPRVQPIRWWREIRESLRALTRPFSLFAGPLEIAFEPVFAQLGLPWRRPAPSRVVAICLAATIGAFGAHHFYLRDRQKGLRYLAFCWTLVPVYLALRDAARLVMIDREEFEKAYM
jgi:TM2 domain-containing membrane protein YozV